MPRVALCFSLFVLLAAQAGAGVRVRVTAEGSARSCMTTGELVATAPGSPAVRVPLRPDRSWYELPLGDTSTWDVRVAADGCWSEVLSWSDADRGTLSFELRPGASLHSRLDTTQKDAVPLTAHLYFSSPGRREAVRPGTPGVRTHCTQNFPEWTCSVPADVSVDVRLDVRGFASIHYWSVAARPREELALEPRELIPGGSLAGWVRGARELPVHRAKITLYPLAAETTGEDRARRAFRGRSAETDARGFFQLPGLEAGTYRLVSEAAALSAATIPEIRIRAGESVVWPRPITHVMPASLEVTLSPAVDPEGKPWTIEIAEKSPLHWERKPPARSAADEEGRWTAGRLRADEHTLTVFSRTGSELEQLDVDLSEGGPKSVRVNIRSIVVRGTLRSHGDPLSAALQFENLTGKVVRTESSESGLFEAIFPDVGKWLPTLRYPRNAPSGSRIALDPVEISAGGNDLEIQVPGGTIHGRVVAKGIAAEATAVRVLRNGKPAAQVVLDGGDEFTLIGLKPGTYSVEAASRHGATAFPVMVELASDEKREVELTIEPYTSLSGLVVTPAGTPASGAVVRFSIDDGRSWSTQVADTGGRFDIRRPAGVNATELVVLTYSHPAAIALVPPTERSVTLTLSTAGGILRIANAPIPYVRFQAFGAPLRAFYYPEPFGRFGGGAYLPAGAYVVCPTRTADEQCRNVVLAPDADITVDFVAPNGLAHKAGVQPDDLITCGWTRPTAVTACRRG